MTGFPMTDSGISEVAHLQLVNGSSRCAGRVEVLYDQVWGTVCDDDWDIIDAGVVCRQLDCGTALSAPGGARFGRGSDPIWLDDVTCTGTEVALSSCRARPWGDNNCNHGEDAGVVCSGAANEEFRKRVLQVKEEQTQHPWASMTGFPMTASMTGFPMTDSGISEVAQLRLVNGPSPCAGRVEVLYNQVWGTVCDDSWDLQDAGVVCRQLDCGTVLSAPGGARFGQGSDHIWLDDVNCAGTENTLSDCGAQPWGTNNCNHGEDAGVVCSGTANEEFLKEVLQVTEEQTLHPWASMTGFPMRDSGISEVAQLRLVNGSSRCAGRVEVLYNQVWGTVCDHDWDITDAGVVCRQLGCGTALSAPGGARFGQGSDPIWLDDVTCTGTEVALSSCGAQPWGDNNCNHGEDAGVVCSDAGISEVAQLRLVNGSSRCAGRVEVLYNQVWGTVCDGDWDITDAGVVCRQLGCGTALSASGGARFGQGSDRIWLDDVNCTGTENTLPDCGARPWGTNNCTHGEDAGVVCSGAANEEVSQESSPGDGGANTASLGRVQAMRGAGCWKISVSV
ncbi:deleted in malignant brain tumors 1 protein-like [Mauremys mutica]|uniref:deleted in malignant brain tumors 1 protein-like n=1 Tax=Mauremys mutica TaxID=74926 RepID=UPI001D162D18|nr:deleted in malignant brain tumors 1 protein-like [Mauremys mutica]